MNKSLSIVMWIAIGLLGAIGFGVIALSRGETISAGWLVVAGVCTYLVAYRFYSRYLAYTVFGLDDRRATPAERLNNGRDFVPTNKWVAAGHHFSAISGAGPLVGPTLAAQFGFLPGTLWLIVGVVLGGAVQDMIVLCASIRRDGKSLGQMAKEEVNPVAGVAAMVAVFAIMIILLAVLALVVVNALRDSPWGLFTIAATIPIALLMGVWMNNIRPGKVAEATGIGIVLLLAALLGGQWVAAHPTWAVAFTWSGTQLAWAVMVYGFIASVLPVWLLLSPRDYLSGVPENRHDSGAGCCDRPGDAAAQDAGGHAVHRRHRAGIRREAVSVRVHHHCVWRDLRFPRADFERHHTKDGDPRESRATHWLWRDADRVVGRVDGHDRGSDARSWRVLRHERRTGHSRHHG